MSGAWNTQQETYVPRDYRLASLQVTVGLAGVLGKNSWVVPEGQQQRMAQALETGAIGSLLQCRELT